MLPGGLSLAGVHLGITSCRLENRSRRIHHATTTSLEGDGNNMIQETDAADAVEEVP